MTRELRPRNKRRARLKFRYSHLQTVLLAASSLDILLTLPTAWGYRGRRWLCSGQSGDLANVTMAAVGAVLLLAVSSFHPAMLGASRYGMPTFSSVSSSIVSSTARPRGSFTRFRRALLQASTPQDQQDAAARDLVTSEFQQQLSRLDAGDPGSAADRAVCGVQAACFEQVRARECTPCGLCPPGCN